jgi:hypothetical protein
MTRWFSSLEFRIDQVFHNFGPVAVCTLSDLLLHEGQTATAAFDRLPRSGREPLLGRA